MSRRLTTSLVLLVNLLAVGAGLLIFRLRGVNHFREQGFITGLSVVQLLAAACLSYRAWRTRGAGGRVPIWKDPSALWALIALGFLFLAADDRFTIHENVDKEIHRLFNLQETGLSDRIDDIVVGLYAVAGISVLAHYRHELSRYPSARPLGVLAFLLLFGMVSLDALTNRDDILLLLWNPRQVAPLCSWLSHVEDSLKLFAEAFFILALHEVLRYGKPVRTNSVASQRLGKREG